MYLLEYQISNERYRLYSRLEKYELPRPECMFDIEYFKKKPEAFFDLASASSGEHVPQGHMFLKLLSDKDCFIVRTRNIDGLERLAMHQSTK